MNYRIVCQYLGLICIAMGVAMLGSGVVAVLFREWRSLEALLGSSAISCGIGGSLIAVGRKATKRIFEREAIALVGLTWLVAGALGAIPFVLSGDLGFNDAFFESVSGLTTTGSTVISDIESVSKSILFWRSLTHWLGGIGIVILFIAVLPYIAAGGKLIVKSESTGPTAAMVLPRFRESAALIFKVYLFLTVANTLAYMAVGMNFYESVCHSFGALATGGFSTRQASIAAYDSVAVELVTIIFMVVGGTNFALFARIALGDWKSLWRDSELRLFLGFLVVATSLVAINLTGVQLAFPHQGESFEPVRDPQTYGILHAARVAAFQVTSCASDTGYVTDDFDLWPYFSRTVLIAVMMLGGCAGSTSSGIKVVRLIMFLKIGYWRIESTFRPKTVRPLRINGEVVSETAKQRAVAFLCLYVLWFAFGCMVMSFMGLPFDSAVGAMAACQNNCGPGLEHVGAIRDFHLIAPPGKFFLSLTMLLGRLELVPILVLFVPSFWRR